MGKFIVSCSLGWSSTGWGHHGWLSWLDHLDHWGLLLLDAHLFDWAAAAEAAQRDEADDYQDWDNDEEPNKSSSSFPGH